MWIKRFLLDDGKIEKDSYLWNMIGSVLMAFQSVFMLMILTRTVGLEEAGIFTIANANANLFLTIGKYGMRNFQVSDLKDQFLFSEYRMSRVVTTTVMIIAAIGYLTYAAVTNDYSMEKAQTILWMCLLKAIDSVEDVYHGLYQRYNRLDIASKAMALRIQITIIVFGAGLIFIQDLLIVLIISTIISTLLFFIFTKWTIAEFCVNKNKVLWSNIGLLLKMNFPLAAVAFLSFYIGNAPKYAIDAVLTDELQACYGFIAMPVFVIGLLNNFIFNPMLYKLSQMWNEKKVREFVWKIVIQTGIVVIITIACIAGAYFMGVPVLSWIYNTDLQLYKMELLILLIGGGFLGLSGLLTAVITIIRHQRKLMWNYAAMAILAYFFSGSIVEKYGMIGAAILYAVLMGGLCIGLIGIFIYGIYKANKEIEVISW
ncbi:lipopolysaccharide biosynthesis protein [Schaedlerella arabinosiphila]|uniref:lipopolysaccharide biosynthesis protein n=1 Tax=Schaedlerella arabinosiphila TaxID=2044587 RepID=UPI0025581719|nr:lipopolysaccharide biosynthesis protein [Schaedlerella arabinosiphila]